MHTDLYLKTVTVIINCSYNKSKFTII